MKKWDINAVRSCFEKEGYVLLSEEYVDTYSLLRSLCPQGHQYDVAWDCFRRRGHRCPECRGVKKLSIARIRSVFEKEGYLLLSTVYRNAHTKLICRCPNEHVYEVSWTNFQQGYRCSQCYGNKKHNFDQIRKGFEKRGFTLLSTCYRGVHSLLKYECPKGHKGRINWVNFERGHGCPKCKTLKRERRLGQILEQIFPGKVCHQDNLGFLNRQSVDYSVRKLKLAFEHDGQQHFEPVRFGMSKEQAKQRFQQQQEWDYRKNRLCEENGYTLIRIAFNEKLTLASVQNKIDQCNAA